TLPPVDRADQEARVGGAIAVRTGIDNRAQNREPCLLIEGVDRLLGHERALVQLLLVVETDPAHQLERLRASRAGPAERLGGLAVEQRLQRIAIRLGDAIEEKEQLGRGPGRRMFGGVLAAEADEADVIRREAQLRLEL